MLRTVAFQTPPKNEKIFSLLIVLMVLFHVYKPSAIPISYGEILMLIFMPLYIKREMVLPIEKNELFFILFFFYTVIDSMILGIVFDAPISKYFSIARIGFYFVLIFFFGKNLFNREVFEKWMHLFSMLLSCYVIVQFFVYFVTGFYIPGLIYGLSVSNGAENGLVTYQHTLAMARWFGYIRPHGFLAEPAHVSQFLFISIVALICNKTIVLRKKILLSALYSVAVLLTQSTTGIALLGFAWLLFISVEKKMSVYRIPLFIAFVASGLYVIFSGESLNLSSLDRIINIANNTEIDGSSNVRLNNGMRLFSHLPFVFKLFGTGAGLSEYVLFDFGFKGAFSYMNALAGIFFSSGIVGGVIWIVALAIMFVMSGLLGKSLVVGFFIMSLGCSTYCQPEMVWFFLLILADIKEKNDRYPCVKL